MDHQIDEVVRAWRAGEMPAAGIAAVFGVSEINLVRAASQAFPLSVRAEALRLFTSQLITALEQDRGGERVGDALLRLRRSDSQNDAVARLFAASR